MKSHEFLIEYNRDVTLRHFGDKVFKQFMSAPAARLAWKNLNPQVQEMLTNQIIDTLEEHDPTPNKQYVPWMAREYSKGNIQRMEDIPSRVQPALEKFHRVKNTRAFAEYLKTEPWVLETFKGPMTKAKDINTIKWWMLEDLMTNYGEPEAEVKNKGESIEAFENEYVRVIVPLDQQAACYYGQGTRWCTAATKGANLFKHYSKQGFLYIIIPKQKLKRPGEKYQLHPQSDQFMDEKDNPVPLSIIDDFPGLKEYFKKKEWAKGLIEFEDPRLIKKLHDTVMNVIEEKTRDEMSAIADEDYTYQDMLWQYARDDDGDIDWYAVENDPTLRYENFVPKYAEIFSKIDDMKSWDAEQIKKAVQRLDDDDWTFWDGYGLFYNKVLRECARYSLQLIITPSETFPRWADEISVVGPYTIGIQK